MIETLFALLENSRGWNAVTLALVSVILYALVSNLILIASVTNRLGVVETTRSLIPKTMAGVLFELLRFGFYVGLPFIALYMGWIDVRSMGLGLLNWAEGVRWAIVILLAAWLLLMVIWLPYLRATADVYAAPNAPLSFARRLVELIYMQAHWAFYRAAAIVLFQGIIPDALYWGSAFGFGLICLEAFTNPRLRAHLEVPGEADEIVWNFGQAILNTLSFIVTRNFYLLMLVQFVLTISVPHLRAPKPLRAPVMHSAVSNPHRARQPK